MQVKQKTKKERVFDQMVSLVEKASIETDHFWMLSTIAPGGVVNRVNHLKEGVDRSLEGERFERKGFEISIENIRDAKRSLEIFIDGIDNLKKQAETLSSTLGEVEKEFDIDYFMREARRRYLLSEPEEIEED
ncbi:MAG: hypothetical protein LUC17_00100 [Oscillospiraceae bacterium]|nr:hypothetical protein [Oscillospiraceae bacterium]